MPPFTVNPQKLDWLAQNFDPVPFAAELDRISQMGSNMITQAPIEGTTPAPAPGSADFSFLQPGAGSAPAPTGNAPLPAGFMQSMMQQPQQQMRAPGGTMPHQTPFPVLPKPGPVQPVSNLHQILYGGK